MDRVISISVGEIALKGQNRKYFEDRLISHVKRAMQGLPFDKVYKEQGKIYIEANEDSFQQIINRVKKVFGIVYISPCIRVSKDIEDIKKAVLKLMKILKTEMM